MENKKIIYYYQTFIGLDDIFKNDIAVTHIYISSVHFGKNNDNSPYIHLNDYQPNDSKFDKLWKDTRYANSLGIKILLMMGGAGSAYTDLFSNFEIYYPLLKNTINKYNWICGIDLDVEESVDLSNIKMLINKLDQDFGNNFIITMAPVAFAMETDSEGLGGFKYKDLYNSKEGRRINWFNVQCYYDLSVDTYDKIIKNGYPEEKIIFGMTYENTLLNFKNVCQIVSNIANKYENFAGVFQWEYINSPPEPNNPSKWSIIMKNITKKTLENKLINLKNNFFSIINKINCFKIIL